MQCVQDVDFCKIAAMPAIFGKQNSLIYKQKQRIVLGCPKVWGPKAPHTFGQPYPTRWLKRKENKQLHTFMRDGKPCAVLHDTPELKDARAKLHAALAPFAPAQPMTGAVQLVVKWLFPAGGRPNGSWKTTKPDTDNLEKALKDEMTRLHFWRDDAQVCSEVAEKFWADTPGIYVEVREL